MAENAQRLEVEPLDRGRPGERLSWGVVGHSLQDVGRVRSDRDIDRRRTSSRFDRSIGAGCHPPDKAFDTIATDVPDVVAIDGQSERAHRNSSHDVGRHRRGIRLERNARRPRAGAA